MMVLVKALLVKAKWLYVHTKISITLFWFTINEVFVLFKGEECTFEVYDCLYDCCTSNQIDLL